MKRSGAYIFILLFTSWGLEAQMKNSITAISATSKEIMDGFMDKRFGMFIHWGPVSLRGTEIGWSRGHQVPVEDYDNLYKEFNPVLFDAEAWVKAAKDAGMKYIILTSKHHDGFCLWPSAYTDYDIMASPFKKDIVGELAKVCKAQDIKFGLYFTLLDWHDKDYSLDNLGDTIPDPKADLRKFVQTIKNQLTELITNYHPYLLWFDGNWEKPWTKDFGNEIYEHIKRLDPSIIINNRLGKGTHKTMMGDVVGDYATPEQEIGAINMNNPWESCITMCSQWAWKPNDKMKSLEECLQTLIKTTSGNGNLLFNVGPMMDGRIEKRQLERLKQMGDWLKKYGESIYETKGGPYFPNADYSATRKGNTVFVHLFNKDKKDLEIPELPGVDVLKASLMNGSTIPMQTKDGKYHFTLPEQLPDKTCNVLVLQLDKAAIAIPLVK